MHRCSEDVSIDVTKWQQSAVCPPDSRMQALRVRNRWAAMKKQQEGYVIACTCRGVTVHNLGKPPNPSGAAFMTRKRFEKDKLPRMRLW